MWTEDQTNTLRILWKDRQTASQIGATLGISTSAVLGKLFRLGLCTRRLKSQNKILEENTRINKYRITFFTNQFLQDTIQPQTEKSNGKTASY